METPPWARSRPRWTLGGGSRLLQRLHPLIEQRTYGRRGHSLVLPPVAIHDLRRAGIDPDTDEPTVLERPYHVDRMNQLTAVVAQLAGQVPLDEDFVIPLDRKCHIHAAVLHHG